MGKTADRTPVIAAIGVTAFTKQSGRSETLLAVEAIDACLAEAGLAPEAVDGLCTFTMDRASETEVQAGAGLGELGFFGRVPFGGGGGCGCVALAAMAVETGRASHVIVYRALNSRSGVRFGSGQITPLPEQGDQSWFTGFGLMTPAARVAITAAHYLERYGLEPEAFSAVALNARRNAANNPAAHFYRRPLSLEEYRQSPWVSWPLRRADCCQESDGAVALLVTSLARARDLRAKPIRIRAAAQCSGADQGQLSQFWEGDILELAEAPGLKRRLEAQASVTLGEVDAAMIYDHFAPLVLLQIEQLGLCEDGAGADFINEGRLPINTHGGHLGEAYIHGMNGITEAVRQLRGQAVNQVAGARTILVTSCASAPTSALILGGE